MKLRNIRMMMLAMILALFFSTGVAAADYNQTEKQQFTMYSQICPEKAQEYAMHAYERFAEAAVKSDSLEIGKEVSLGTPFTIFLSKSDSTVYYFPIISNQCIAATFRVYVDLVQTQEKGSVTYTGILSPFLAEELNGLAAKKDVSEPILLYLDQENIMADIDGNKEILVPSREGTSPINVRLDLSTEELEEVSPMEPMVLTKRVSTPLRANYASLNLSIIETQGSNSWCGAYSTSIILRFLMEVQQIQRQQG